MVFKYEQLSSCWWWCKVLVVWLVWSLRNVMAGNGEWLVVASILRPTWRTRLEGNPWNQAEAQNKSKANNISCLSIYMAARLPFLLLPSLCFALSSCCCPLLPFKFLPFQLFCSSAAMRTRLAPCCRCWLTWGHSCIGGKFSLFPLYIHLEKCNACTHAETRTLHTLVKSFFVWYSS